MKSGKPRQSTKVAAPLAGLPPDSSPNVRRDRHGVLVDALDTWESPDFDRDHALLLGRGALHGIAATVFWNRNAQGARGYPVVHAEVRPGMRKHLRDAIAQGVLARKALLADDDVRFELHIARAKLALEAAQYPMREAERPFMTQGKKFKEGRQSGTKGPIRREIARLLKKQPKATVEELWMAIKARPPKGCTVMENRLGRYIEGPGAGKEMQYARFRNVCILERKALTNSG